VDKNTRIYAVVLAGGRGERFWPKSRAARPKQLQALTGGKTMIEETLVRVAPLAPPARQWIITSTDLAQAVSSVVGTEPKVIGEPMGRNTAPAIAMAASEIARSDPEAVMLVLPSDHHIREVGAFRSVLAKAVGLGEQGYLATIGLRPERPETGYGYIELGKPLGDEGCFGVKSFREKPDPKTAEEFVASGTFLWNGGIFAWKVSIILEQIREHMAALYQATMNWQSRGGLGAGPEVFRQYFQPLEKISIDYGVMEKAARAGTDQCRGVAVVPGDFGWDDLGSWEAAARYYPGDGSGNRVSGKALALDSKNNIVVCDQGLVALLGVEGLVVVRSGDAVLVCRRERAQEVRRVVEELGRAGEAEFL
jgi:mannose-1-phosphate guanylyltransferase